MDRQLKVSTKHLRLSAPVKVYIFLLIALLLISALVFFMFRLNMQRWCAEVGEVTGKSVGRAVGSYNGYINGMKDGAKDGKDKGLSAEDTTVSIKEAVTSGGKLEVLSAGVTIRNSNDLGESYKGIRIANGDAIFTVDLRIAQVLFSEDGNEVNITIPRPELQLYPDLNSTIKLAEKTQFSFTVTAEEGYIAYINSLNESVLEASKSIANYDALKELAEKSAKNQVIQLVSAIAPQGISVNVDFER